jgi:hypothetical protein
VDKMNEDFERMLREEEDGWKMRYVKPPSFPLP